MTCCFAKDAPLAKRCLPQLTIAALVLAWGSIFFTIGSPDSFEFLSPIFSVFSVGCVVLAGFCSVLNKGREKRKDLLSVFCIFTSAALLFLPRLSGGSLEIWDEAYYGQISREMIRTGNFLTPYFMGKPFIDKPPFYYWLTCLNFLLFGETILSIRLWAGLFACGTATILFLLLRKIGRPLAGCLAALVYSQLPMVQLIGGMGTLDSGLNFLIALVLWFTWESIQRDRLSLWLGVLLGLIAMLKGAAILFPLFVIGLIVICFGKLHWFYSRQSFYILGLILLIAGPWNLYIFITQRQEFLSHYIEFGVIQRAFSGHEGKTGDAFFYIRTLALHRFFHYWRWLFLGAVLSLFPYSIRKLQTPEGLFLTAALGFLMTQSLLATKNFWYIMPVLPPLCLLVGLAVERMFSEEENPASTLIPLACALVFTEFFIHFSGEQWSVVLFLLILVVFGFCGWISVNCLRFRKYFPAVLIALVVIFCFQPVARLDFTSQRIKTCQKIIPLAEGNQLITWGILDPCDVFYLSEYPEIQYLTQPEEISECLGNPESRQENSLIVLTQYSWDTFPQYREIAKAQSLELWQVIDHLCLFELKIE